MATITDATESVLAKIQQKFTSGDWAAGQLLPSERRIADELNISRRLLRNALQELTRSGQLKRHEPRGYMVVGTTSDALPLLAQTFGILTPVPSERWKADSTPNRTEDGIRCGVIQGGSHLMQFFPDSIDQATVGWMKENHFAGVIATHEVSQTARGQEILKLLRAYDIPVVAHGNSLFLQNYDRIYCDQFHGMYEMTKWLLEQGCRRILRVWGSSDPQLYWLQMRNRGYLQAHREMGIEPVDALHWPGQDVPLRMSPEERCEFFARIATGYLAQPLLQSPGMDAMICVSDGIIEPFARACEYLQLDPNNDLKICGHDDFWRQVWHQLSSLKAPAATVNTHPNSTGHQMVDLLRQRVGRLLPNEPQHQILKPDLVITES